MEAEQQVEATTETTLTTLSPVPFTDAAETKLDVLKQEDSNPNSGSNTSVTPAITFTIPPHLMGRDINNPIDDVIGTGRKVPKPRLGVKVPYRNLTSQIVTQDEIAQEIFERSHKKYPYLDCPEGGDLFFAKKLTHRLANRIVPTSACSSGNNNATELKCDRPSSAGLLCPKNISQLTPLKMVSNDVNNSESMQYDSSASAGSPGLEVNNLNRPQVNRVSMPERKKFQPFPLIKLLPELEKELALKQLMEFSKPRQKKDRLKTETMKKQLVKEKRIIVRRKKRSENNNNVESKTLDVNKVPKKRGRKKKSEILQQQMELAKKTNSGILTNNNNNFVDSAANEGADTTADVSQITEVLPVEGCEITSVKDNRYLKKYSNKRLLAKRPPSPPPIEILMNGIESVNDKVNKNEEECPTLKNKRLRKRRRVVPMKRIKLEEQKTNFPVKQNGETSTVKKIKGEQQPVDKSRSRMMREINRLLGDEGAINMIYSVEQKRTPGSEPKRVMLPSVRRKKKDLLLKTKLVKSAVLRLSTIPQTLVENSLRRRRTLPTTVAENRYVQAVTPQRKFSSDSHDSHQSLHSPMQPELFPFPAKIIVPADASRIIRRHSSSSSYSSRSNSPRRMSIDADRTGHAVFIPEGTSEEQAAFLAENTWSTGHEGESVSQEVDRSDTASQLSKTPSQGSRNKEISESDITSNTNTGGSVLNKEITQIVKVKLKAEMSKNLINSINGDKVLRGRRKVIYTPEMRERSAQLNTCLNDAVLDFTSSESSPLPPPASVSPAALNKGSTTVHSMSTRHSFAQSSIDNQRPSASEETARSPVAATKQNFKEITLRRYDHLVQIILTPVSTKMKNALNVQVLRELISAMNQLKKDDSCRTVVLTSTGNVFCQGVDFSALIQHTPDKRQSAALEMAVAVKDFVKNLATFTKPIIAGVHGAAVGLGVTMLPFFDMVFASDKATFHTPYAKLGQVPEGAATLTLPSTLGNTATSELLFTCRILTASEALHFGLITRILWSGSFQEELISLVRGVASQSSQSMDATKALLRHRLCTNLETTLVSESHLLVQHWSSSECQENFKKYLEEELIALQKQRESNN